MIKKKHSNKIVLAFKRWTRKTFAVFRSIGLVVNIRVVALTFSMLLLQYISIAQVDSLEIQHIDIEEVIVSEDRAPAVYSQMTRIVEVFRQENIENTASRNLQSLLGSALNTDIRQRGANDIQADITIRGGTFDQCLILLNGININDPQTGHYNLNLPIDFSDIKQIEILYGPAARVYGTNAFCGAVNVITTAREKNKISTAIEIGEHNLYKLSARTVFGKNTFQNSLSVSKSQCEGYAENTAFETHHVYYQSLISKKKHTFAANIGYKNKNFDANTFYSPRFSEQHDHNKTTFASLNYTFNGHAKYSLSSWYRQHFDHYILIKSNPKAYQNYHLTKIFGAKSNISIPSKHGKTNFGVEYRYEKILSNNLGNEMAKPVDVPNTDSAKFTKSDSRPNLSFFAEHNIYFNRLIISSGAMINFYKTTASNLGIYPGIEIAYRIFENIEIYASINKSLRLPTFTDLYYSSPTNLGNKNLKAEEAITYETGIKYTNKIIQSHITYFQRNANNIIDWIWQSDIEKWKTENITALTTRGVEFHAAFDFNKLFDTTLPFKQLTLQFAQIESEKKETPQISKYQIDNLKYKFSAQLKFEVLKKIGMNYNFTYRNREGIFININEAGAEELSRFEPYWLLDVAFSYKTEHIKTYIDFTNILNTKYLDIGSVEQAGRWIKIGFQIEFPIKSKQSK